MATQSMQITTLEIKQENFQGKVVNKIIINGKWSAFAGKWNSDWIVGGVAKGIFTEKVINGRTYYNIGCPPELRPQQAQGGSLVQEEILKVLIEIREILKPKEKDMFAELSETDQGTTPADIDIPIDEIPF